MKHGILEVHLPKTIEVAARVDSTDEQLSPEPTRADFADLGLGSARLDRDLSRLRSLNLRQPQPEHAVLQRRPDLFLIDYL